MASSDPRSQSSASEPSAAEPSASPPALGQVPPHPVATNHPAAGLAGNTELAVRRRSRGPSNDTPGDPPSSAANVPGEGPVAAGTGRSAALDLTPFGGDDLPEGLQRATSELLRRIGPSQRQFECAIRMVGALRDRLAAGESAIELERVLRSPDLQKLLRLGGEVVCVLLERRAPLESVQACRGVERRLAAFFAPALSRRERDVGLAEVWDDPELVQPGGGPVTGNWRDAQTRRTLLKQARKRGVAQRGLFTRAWRFTFRWVPRCLLLCSLLWGLVVAWLIWSRPAYYESQLGFARQRVARVAPEDRAWPLLRQWGVAMRDVRRYREDPFIPPGGGPNPAGGGPPDAVSLAEIEQHPGPIELLLQASQRPELGFDPDVVDDDSSEDGDLLSRIYLNGETPSQPLKRLLATQGLLARVRRELKQHFELAQQSHDLRRAEELLAARIRLQALQFEGGNLLHWGDLFLSRGQLTGDVVRFLQTIEEDVTRVDDRHLLELREALLQLERPLAEANQPGTFMWQRDRELALDELYAEGPIGLITADGLEHLRLFGNPLHPLLGPLPGWESFSPDQVLDFAWAWAKAPVATLLVATRAQAEAVDEQLAREAETLVKNQGMLRTVARRQLENQWLNSRWRRMRWAPLTLIGQRWELAQSRIWNPWLAGVRQARIQLAALRHARRTGKWPQQIAELVPAELDAIPQNPFGEIPADLDWANSQRQPMPNPRPAGQGVDPPDPQSP